MVYKKQLLNYLSNYLSNYKNEINKDLENCNNILKPEYELKVHVIYLEKIINNIIDNYNNKLLNDHFKLMKEKYIFEIGE